MLRCSIYIPLIIYMKQMETQYNLCVGPMKIFIIFVFLFNWIHLLLIPYFFKSSSFHMRYKICENCFKIRYWVNHECLFMKCKLKIHVHCRNKNIQFHSLCSLWFTLTILTLYLWKFLNKLSIDWNLLSWSPKLFFFLHILRWRVVLIVRIEFLPGS